MLEESRLNKCHSPAHSPTPTPPPFSQLLLPSHHSYSLLTTTTPTPFSPLLLLLLSHHSYSLLATTTPTPFSPLLLLLLLLSHHSHSYSILTTATTTTQGALPPFTALAVGEVSGSTFSVESFEKLFGQVTDGLQVRSESILFLSF